ncbi:DUF302 domain-containing protein [Lamprobacter modestohalophilus]|nr:DUF302 domain-containing protein [Lamprobacter modestohalophilus]
MRATLMKPMCRAFLSLLLLLLPLVALAANDTLTQRISPYSVGETLDRLEAVLGEKGVTVFARIDHSAGAKDAGLTLRPMQLLIFGNPKAGTPLMQAAPTIGLDLPLKVLAWEDDAGKVHVVWNSPSYLIERHGLDAGYTKNLAAVEGLISAALK